MPFQFTAICCPAMCLAHTICHYHHSNIIAFIQCIMVTVKGIHVEWVNNFSFFLSFFQCILLNQTPAWI